MFNQRKNHRDIFSHPTRHDDEEVVQNGLAVTPSQMLDMAEHNIPITPANLGLQFEEGVSDLDFQPPAEYKRGMDVADLWELRESTKSKFKKNFAQAQKVTDQK